MLHSGTLPSWVCSRQDYTKQGFIQRGGGGPPPQNFESLCTILYGFMVLGDLVGTTKIHVQARTKFPPSNKKSCMKPCQFSVQWNLSYQDLLRRTHEGKIIQWTPENGHSLAKISHALTRASPFPPSTKNSPVYVWMDVLLLGRCTCSQRCSSSGL